MRGIQPLGKVALVGAFFVATASYGAVVYQVVVERGVPVTMRDSTVLRADIYRPNVVNGRFPVLLQRTPYNKSGGTSFGYEAAGRGYVAIIQDVRGRYSSDGEWYPFRFESEDGYDTVEWASSLPYSDGKVGMFGGSYVGATQMLTAIAHPPHLAGICPVVTASNYHENWTYQGGAFQQWFNESWTSGLAQDTLNRLVQKSTNAMQGVWTALLTDYPLFNFTHALTKEGMTATLAPYFLDWLAHPNYDEYWKRWSIEEHYADIKVPALTVSAWYDLFQGGSLHNYLGLKAHGGSEAARTGQHLIVAIGGHAGTGEKIGEVDFGHAAAEYNEDAVTLSWYDHLFKGAQNEFADSKPVRIFVMGENAWRDESEWPLERAQERRYYLHAAHGANSMLGDGALSVTAPASETTDHYVYDPARPVPTIGGPLCCDSKDLAPGPRDQRPAEARDDVLVYSTPPFDNDLEVTGPVKLDLYAESSRVDTDFTAKLVDVWPTGFVQNLTEGIIRARYRESRTAPEMMTPGQVYRFTIDMWSTSNVFKKGHALRLEVSSSNFPRFDRNLNTGDDPVLERNGVSATNTIWHDAEHPSALIIQVVPK
jgi:putative CocE/NonD family hydrolase